ncbi:MAG TPA: GspH/FimT family pseudopilin [Wenzhouxiangella sp.]|nr:GspH/FimT family pseudopilin [Wenzhouxiangella sp.]
MKQPTCQQASRGFTVIELLIVVTITAALLVIAVPNFRDLVKRNQMTNTSNGLVTALQLARSEAVKRKKKIVVCASDTAADTPVCGSDWHQGWLVLDDKGERLRVWPSVSENIKIGAGDSEDEDVDKVVFSRRGQIDGDKTVTFEIRTEGLQNDCRSGDYPPNARDVDINLAGQVNTKPLKCAP